MEAMGPVPRQLESAKEREQAMLRQRELLQKECEQDIQGQRFRTDAVKSDLSVLDEALKHLQSLRSMLPAKPNTAEATEQSSLLEVDEGMAEPKCTDPAITGPIVRCQNGYYVPVIESNGTISTYPPGNGMMYNQQLKCGFKIIPADAGPLDRVELNFLAINTLANVDYVEVYDGSEVVEENLLTRLSGQVSNPPKVRSKSSHVTIMYVVKGNPKKDSFGFVATFKAIHVPVTRSSAINLCAGTHGVPLVLTGQSGFVAEDARPEFADALQARAGTVYSQAQTCSWLIQASQAQTIRLHFTFLNTEPERDFVSIYDGDDAESRLLHRLSGSQVPEDIFSSSNFLFITYKADYTVDGFGFHASWCVNGTTCPKEGEAPELPAPVPIVPVPEPAFNASAPNPAPIAAPPDTVYVAPPDYPVPTPSPQEGTCCAKDCNNHGLCNPTTCTCACYTGFTNTDCSATTESLTGNVLMELDSGLDSGDAISSTTATRIEDACGDDVEDLESPQQVQHLNLDPVTSLLERLKFELFRSLTYEHDTTNITKKQCAEELRQHDRDLADLQQQVLMLGKTMSDMDAHAKALTEKRDSLVLAVSSYETYASELTSRIQSSKSTRDTRQTSQQQELATLQQMRELISKISDHQCTREAKSATDFQETAGVECFGELLESELHTQDPNECKSMCAFGCVGFTYHSHQGCRFFSSIREHTNSCAGGSGVATCSCFQKA
eukprot:c8413_g1_i1.p1 GENE.c8413_g1_i1~~c8413_g1_i1.p1  ORF type:complete len:846 (+),score=210.12 c8413_g1_i1:371-2539(+)